MLSRTTIALLACSAASSAAAAPDSWSGKLDLNIFVGASDCATGNATYSGYTSAAKAIGDGNVCETDHYDFFGEGVATYYTKWVTLCGSQGPLTSAMYQFSFSCTDSNCSDCTNYPNGAAQIPWSYFDPQPRRCMTFNSFNASTTDPAKEFRSAGDFASLIAPTSESFVGSDEDFHGYWGVFLANSCMGPEPNTTTASPTTPVQTPPAPSATVPPSSAHDVAGGIDVVLFVFVVSTSLLMFFIA